MKSLDSVNSDWDSYYGDEDIYRRWNWKGIRRHYQYTPQFDFNNWYQTKMRDPELYAKFTEELANL